jgi:two-component system response regulator YesN
MAANHLGISAGYLSSVFKRVCQVGFAQYVIRVKIAEAKGLLLTGQYKIYEVSEKMGFEEPSYFIRTFRKVVGATPKEYISSHAEDDKLN